MSWEEVKKSTENLAESFAKFKDANEERIKKLEAGASTGNSDEVLKKYDEQFEELEKKFEKSVAAMKRSKIETEVTSGEAAKEAKSLMNKLMKKNSLTPDEMSRLHELNGEEYKLLSVQNDNEGGYLVRPEVSNDITEKVFESSPLRQLAEVVTIGSDAWEEPYDNDEPESGWVGETQERPETDSNKINMLRIPTHELYAEPKATQKMLDDSFFDVESWHQRKVVAKFARDEATAFISGDGVLRPKGILSYEAGDGFNKVQQIDGSGSSVIAANDLISLQDALFEEFQANAKWLMTRTTRSAIRKLKDNDGRYLFSIDTLAGLNGGQPFMLLDKEIHIAADMQEVAQDALPVAYGDFKMGYKVVDRMGIRVIRDALTRKGFVKFYTTKRVGGGVQQFQAIKLLKTIA